MFENLCAVLCGICVFVVSHPPQRHRVHKGSTEEIYLLLRCRISLLLPQSQRSHTRFEFVRATVEVMLAVVP
jgi:hypothetical protein